MKIISHRGNVNGSDFGIENTSCQIDYAYSLGYEVEIDVWFIDGNWHLGHDNPGEKINTKWLKQRRKWLWCHAKNLEAVYELNMNKMHCFWHETDKMTFTNRGIPWCYPGIFLKNGISVLKNKDLTFKTYEIKGVCTDYPIYFKNRIIF